MIEHGLGGRRMTWLCDITPHELVSLELDLAKIVLDASSRNGFTGLRDYEVPMVVVSAEGCH